MVRVKVKVRSKVKVNVNTEVKVKAQDIIQKKNQETWKSKVEVNIKSKKIKSIESGKEDSEQSFGGEEVLGLAIIFTNPVFGDAKDDVSEVLEGRALERFCQYVRHHFQSGAVFDGSHHPPFYQIWDEPKS